MYLSICWLSNTAQLGTAGTANMCYALCDTSNIAQPLCRSVDPWVHWHEMGGHGTLGDHVNSGNFGFAHSAGDGLAALQMDPESALRGTIDRYLADFDRIVKDAEARDPSGRLATGHLVSETGRVYLFLNHASGRLS